MKMVQKKGGKNQLSQRYHQKSKMESLTQEGFLDINAIDNNPGLGDNFQQRRTMMNKE